MLGCIQPISSPMMNRMLGFCCVPDGCCACAGTGAIAAAAHIRIAAAMVFPSSLNLISSSLIAPPDGTIPDQDDNSASGAVLVPSIHPTLHPTRVGVPTPSLAHTFLVSGIPVAGEPDIPDGHLFPDHFRR